MLMESASEHTELTDTPLPLMSASSSESEGESRAMGNPSDMLEYVNDRVDVLENTTKKGEQNRASPPPYSPDMRMQIWFYSCNLPMPFKTFIEWMVSSPVETQSILPRAPIPIPECPTQSEPELMMVVAANEDVEHPESSAQVFFTQIQTDSISSNHVKTIPALGRSHSLDNSEMNRQTCTEPWRDKKTKKYQALCLNMPLDEDSADHSKILPTEECIDHPINSTEEKSQPINATSPMSKDSQPCDSSMPASARSDSTDDYNQFSLMSLDDMQ
ncbi:hypothetical protein ARMGADRAFT_1040249 [Armillaria gallica]|uniref:Uncharacterized protein n=1 Tax=Armillaria gallica TaxID=47427 RepID=A0A2H3CE75_ARMGA|nr:hypothetical protein ARMGADRAFT_1040249 [Armillaria gallica]